MTTARKPTTIGIDPGGRYTGIALVAGDLDPQQRRILIGAKVVTSPAGPLLAAERLPRACAEVLAAIDEALESAAAAHPVAVDVEHTASYLDLDSPPAAASTITTRLATPAELVDLGELVVAVEGLAPPKGFAGGQRAPIDPQGVIAAGVILGAVLGRWPRAVVVDPGGNGSNPDITYPEQLRKGTRGLGGPTTHARSAYDVAVRARATAAMRANFAAQADPSPFRATPRG